MKRSGHSSDFEAAIVPVCARSKQFRSEKKRESFPYNPLLDKSNNSYFSNPSVMYHLIKKGFVANDGSVVPTSSEEHRLKQAQRAAHEQQLIMRKVEERKEARLDRLRKCAHMTELMSRQGQGQRQREGQEHTARVAVQPVHMAAKAEKDKLKKPKKLKKKQFHIEKDKDSSPETYILYPPQTSSFLQPPAPRPEPPPTVWPAKDVFTTPPTQEELQDLVRDRQTSSEPLHFHLAAPNVPKACKSLKEAIASRDTDPELLLPGEAERLVGKKRIVRPHKYSNRLAPPLRASSGPEHFEAPKLHANQLAGVMEGKQREVVAQHPSKKGAAKDAVLPTKRSLSSSGGETAENFNSSKLAESKRLPKIDTPPRSSSKLAPVARNTKLKKKRSTGSESQLCGYEKLKAWNFNRAYAKEKAVGTHTDHVAAKKVEEESALSGGNVHMDRAFTVVFKDSSASPKKSTAPTPRPPRPSIPRLQPKVAEVGIQTRGSRFKAHAGAASSMGEVEREDLLELLRELVVTPRQHLDSVMELIENELCQPEVSYNKMLRHVHEYSAIEDEGSLAASARAENQFSHTEERKSKDLQRASGLIPSSICASSGPALAGLARHVVEDFMFDQNKITGCMVSKGLSAPKKSDVLKYVIEHGEHGLHKALSFQPHGQDGYENWRRRPSDENSGSGSGGSSGSACNRTPSMASCHFNKVTGEIYHMYLRKDGTAYFSMLSPRERGLSSNSTYLGSYRENRNDKMTLVATPSTLSRRSSLNEVDLDPRDSCSSLDEVTCSVERVPGYVYFKYRKRDGTSFLTTVSPRSWGPSCPHTFVKAYREARSGVLVPLRAESIKDQIEVELGTDEITSLDGKKTSGETDTPVNDVYAQERGENGTPVGDPYAQMSGDREETDSCANDFYTQTSEDTGETGTPANDLDTGETGTPANDLDTGETGAPANDLDTGETDTLANDLYTQTLRDRGETDTPAGDLYAQTLGDRGDTDTLAGDLDAQTLADRGDTNTPAGDLDAQMSGDRGETDTPANDLYTQTSEDRRDTDTPAGDLCTQPSGDRGEIDTPVKSERSLFPMERNLLSAPSPHCMSEGDSEGESSRLQSISEYATLQSHKPTATKHPLRNVHSMVECNFPRVPGKVYHLYRRRTGSTFLSALPPQEADQCTQDTFVASYMQGKSKKGRMRLVKSDNSTMDAPETISCINSEELRRKSFRNAITKPRSLSQELVDTLLRTSDTEMSDRENSTRSWVDGFLKEIKESQDVGATIQTSDKELREEIHNIPARTSQRSMSIALESFKSSL